MINEPLGTDRRSGGGRAETVLLPAFDAWRTGGDDSKDNNRQDRDARLGIC